MKKIIKYIFPVILAGALFYSFNPALSCREIMDKMTKSVTEVKTLKYDLKLVERIERKYNYFGSSVKLNRKPRKLYLNAKGIEVLWVEGKHNGDALVNPNSFPYINLYLDPYGSLMRQDQHHTINEAGFDYFGSIIDANVKRTGDKFDKYFIPDGEEIINGRTCYKVIINNKDFGVVNYTVAKGENLISIARKLFVGEYMILNLNKSKVDDYKDVKAGQVIQVPNAYAKYVLLYIDKQNFLPIGVRVFDDKGLYEQYDYFNVQVNPTFEDAEFTRDYKGYGF
ncbi:MAG TPA: LysM peptidoglycan-binding domain-containing protein [Bacteroidia bacterium]|nr:LysM peptidoglycan-binding domain-containing protein [Bacteroidia bacterium]